MTCFYYYFFFFFFLHAKLLMKKKGLLKGMNLLPKEVALLF